MNWKGRGVLVTGGAGFLGGHLVEALHAHGATVTVLDSFTTGRDSTLAPFKRNIRIIRGSTNDPMAVRQAMEGVDVVFHLAAVLGIRRTVEEPVRVLQENLLGSSTVLRAAAELGVSRVVTASSSGVYGHADPPFSEEKAACPYSGYATAKLAEEKLLEAYIDEGAFTGSALRFFNLYGPRQENSQYGFVTAIFTKRVLQGLRPVVFGDGQQTRDFTFVRDAVDAMLRAGDRPDVAGPINIGTGVETTIHDLACAIAKAAGRPDLEPEHAPTWPDDIRRRFADPKRARERLDWTPRHPLSEGLRHVIAASQITVAA
ncbi:MAG: NAD-dependent epimerase/dehydratase family protein [Thermoplasmatota archaeon]